MMKYFRRNKSFALVLGILMSPLAAVMFLPSRIVRSESKQPLSAPSSQKFNGKIAFISNRTALGLTLFTMNPDGSNAVQLPTGADQNFYIFEYEPAWSPDGSQLAFVSNRNSSHSQIFSIKADGTNLHRISDDLKNDAQPAWSPNGTQIAFTQGGGCVIITGNRSPFATPAQEDCTPFIYKMNVDGSNRVKLADIPGQGAVWSPDGTRIAFNSDGKIVIMNSDGSNRVQVTNGSSNDYVSSWSPDGQRLAFTSNRDLPPDSFLPEIYTMKIDGSDVVRLTQNETDDEMPVFSPDGTKIAFQRGLSYLADENADIYVMNVDGSNQTNLTNNEAEDFGPPAWQPLASPAQLPPPAVLQFEFAAYNVHEGAGSLQIKVVRSGSTTETTSFMYDTARGTASNVSDYTDALGLIHFASGETSKTITVLLTDDGFAEGTETLSLSLHDLTGNAILGNPGSATVSITDNDVTPAPVNPLRNAEFFVRQHYHDFLNREPDPAGLAFWVNNIESCGTNTSCREGKEIDTSAAFFLSTEFQQTGFYVYRLWVVALSSEPGFKNFLRDTQEIARDVIVGTPNWELRLETQTQAVTEAFVSRPLFRLLYPDTMSAQTFVDRLYSNGGVIPPTDERNQTLAAFGNGDAPGRARALRLILNNTIIRQRLFNGAFVSQEYYGYLRRDADFFGQSFWRTKLNQFNGDFRRAEMVKAFLASSEYRSRFGQ